MALRSYMLAFLLCSDLAVGMRFESPDDLIDQEEIAFAPVIVSQPAGDSPDPGQLARVNRIARLSCDEIPTNFAQCIEDVEVALHQHFCTDGGCHSAEGASQQWTVDADGKTVSVEVLDTLEEAASSIFELVRHADRSECLAQTVEDFLVHVRAGSLRLLWTDLIADTSSHERFAQATALIGTWRERLLAGAKSFMDQKLVFPFNVQDPLVCPDSCERCTREHNSIWEDEEDLSFKCILPRGGSAPSSSDLSCSEPAPRSGIAGVLQGQMKTWCECHSWRVVTHQDHVLRANITCGTESVLGPLRHGIEMSERMYDLCLTVERGEHVNPIAKQEYSYFATINAIGDDVIPEWQMLTFRVITELELAQGLVDLRRAARGRTAQSVE